jgi:hypothetical protein
LSDEGSVHPWIFFLHEKLIIDKMTINKKALICFIFSLIITHNVLQICDGGLLTTELYAKHELKISVA